MFLAVASGFAGLLTWIGIVVALCAFAIAALAGRAERLARRLSGTVSSCAQAASVPHWRGLLSGHAEGPSTAAALSGEPAVWWHVKVTTSADAVVADQQSADTIVLADDTGHVAVHVEALDPHPEQLRRWACLTDPLVDRDGAQLRELEDGEVSPGPYTATEFSVREGQTIVLMGARRPEGTVGSPRRGRQRFFAPASPDWIAANAHRGAISLAKFAATLAAIAAALIGAGLLLR